MDSETKDVLHAQSWTNEKALVSLSKEVMREHLHKHMEDGDSDFLKYLNAEYTSIRDDLKPGFSIDGGDDPSYALFFSSLKNNGSSYVLEANEKTGLKKPLNYMGNEPNGEDENDLDSHAKMEGIEFQSNYDSDYKLFFENMRLEGSNVIYQYRNGASAVYDSLIFLNSQTDDNVVSKKQKYTDAIQHGTTSKGIEEAVAANEDLKQLNLLRGFSFWLQKISRSDGQKRISLMTNHSFYGTTKNVLIYSQKDPKWKCKTLKNRHVHNKSRERLRKSTTHETRYV
ncbi:hypothetical protein M9H77_11499 [Catharanthus roseus]|uniref:Uncharacterized protein n=1 Tax=Catharanthus roseus TaxID=4058 RepID=A0ACC0BEN8_CATRO|nr:hypothetical protein M9H77_11499 [Catharanthus roseus]